MEEILEIFQKIEWEKLQSASKIENINENIKNLISDEMEISEKAYWKFDNVIVLQGDLYEAAFYIIPFLFKLLENTKNIDKILDLLFEISNGSSFDKSLNKYEYVNFMTIKMPFLYYIPSFDKNDQIKILEKACKDAINEQKYILELHLINNNISLNNYKTILDIFLNLRDYNIKETMENISDKINNSDKQKMLNEYFDEL